jgi:hypothetical protein
MTVRYEEYCHASRFFYDIQARTDSTGTSFSDLLPSLPDGWTVHRRDNWLVLRPAGTPMPQQGWKIHVSSGMANAETVLLRTHDYCVAHRIPFKHLHNKDILLARNSKYAPRSASGKLVTIYPDNDEQLTTVLTELGTVLDGENGPYVLSDLRFGAGPLYVRYGGFLERSTVDEHGSLVPAIQRPDGTLVPDLRRPGFHVPDWVTLPEVLRPHVEARTTSTAGDFPYRVNSALHFSNGGGVYLATRLADGAEVVLKEARPLAGLDRDGTDATVRLAREWRTLLRLFGIPGVPVAHELFTGWEHHFLAMERVRGLPLGRWLAVHYPLSRHDVSAAEVADYTRRALHVMAQIEQLVSAVHERGVVFGDLHDRNLLVDEHDTVSLIDFELAFDVTEPGRPALGAAGFAAPPDRTGFAIDDYASASLALWMFLPLNVVLTLDRNKLADYLRVVEERFPVPDGYLARIRDRMAPAVPPAATATQQRVPDWGTDWEAVRGSIAAAIVRSATPEREDRLFPGDIDTFTLGGAVFECGASGVLHALAASGAGRFPVFERWLIDSVRREPPRKAGFYDGAHGIAHVLAGFGYREPAAQLVAEYAPLVAATTDHGLRGGLSGIGLNLLHLADAWHDDNLCDQGIDIGERLADLLRTAGDDPVGHARAGLLHGWAGPALLFVALYRLTRDPGWLDVADRALLRDLRECVSIEGGALQVRDGDLRTLPYLGIGSAGIAVVIDRLAVHRPGAECTQRLAGLRQSLLGEFVVQSGLLYGRAGFITAIDSALRAGPDPVLAAARDRHLAHLSWHAVPHRGDIAFPGNRLLRLSMDLGTGGAGVLLAVSAATTGLGDVLPFLGHDTGGRHATRHDLPHPATTTLVAP